MSHLQAMGAAEREGPVQGRLYRSLKLWTFYCDLEESLGTPDSTRAAYDRIMQLRIATPQIVLNYAAFLQVSYCYQPKLYTCTDNCLSVLFAIGHCHSRCQQEVTRRPLLLALTCYSLLTLAPSCYLLHGHSYHARNCCLGKTSLLQHALFA